MKNIQDMTNTEFVANHVDKAAEAFTKVVNAALIDAFDELEKASKEDDYTGVFDEVIDYMKNDSKGEIRKAYNAFDRVISYLRKNIK
tara:strand:+ start:88 stop:348 length:261 start_codon:yes stop_codon:yes gene_type:complete